MNRLRGRVPGELDRIARPNGGYGGAGLRGRRNRARDQIGARKRARGIVNDDQVRRVAGRRECVRDGVLTPLAPGHDSNRSAFEGGAVTVSPCASCLS